jgi:uncharacterized repeat protein (TIGR04138 family)
MPNETPTESPKEQSRSFEAGLEQVLAEDRRYAREAYYLVLEALSFTCRELEREGHVTGRELLEGLRKHVLKEYGPMARVTLSEWGIERCEDVGAIVFNLVNHNLLRKTDEDSIEDFSGGYDFREAFEAPFEP